ncbi:MAG: carboxymuconolactone decarboxylase family protein [Brumimicrobium sp.]|nr:carboxymuconolactone decarboxylase family protein [Brumimicrobium sp.]
MKIYIQSIAMGVLLLLVFNTSLLGQSKKITKTEGFITNFEQAKKEAAALNQPIFAFFTGSDWCYWCKHLQEEVLSTPAFKDYAKQHFVLFIADFPQKTAQSDELKKQNKELVEKYDVTGFPTVFLMDATGKAKVKSGYRPGGPENYIKELNDALAEGKSSTSQDMIVGCGYTANTRIDYVAAAPECVKALYDIEEYLGNCGLEQTLLTLIRSRVSQINGCAYCLDGHTKEANDQKIDDQRIYLLPVWREAPCYTDRERAALAWAEALTLLPQNEIGDELYNKVRRYFNEKELVDLTYGIVSINSWNRIAVSMRSPVGEGW